MYVLLNVGSFNVAAYEIRVSKMLEVNLVLCKSDSFVYSRLVIS
jgi:hypothetical protein